MSRCVPRNDRSTRHSRYGSFSSTGSLLKLTTTGTLSPRGLSLRMLRATSWFASWEIYLLFFIVFLVIFGLSLLWGFGSGTTWGLRVWMRDMKWRNLKYFDYFREPIKKVLSNVIQESWRKTMFQHHLADSSPFPERHYKRVSDSFRRRSGILSSRGFYELCIVSPPEIRVCVFVVYAIYLFLSLRCFLNQSHGIIKRMDTKAKPFYYRRRLFMGYLREFAHLKTI